MPGRGHRLQHGMCRNCASAELGRAEPVALGAFAAHRRYGGVLRRSVSHVTHTSMCEGPRLFYQMQRPRMHYSLQPSCTSVCILSSPWAAFTVGEKTKLECHMIRLDKKPAKKRSMEEFFNTGMKYLED